MATGGDSTPAETLDCPVCSKQFLIPRRLPCLHTVCEKCLDIHINQQGRCGCPLCNEQLAPPDTTIGKDKWASAFPLNELVESLIESQNKCINEDNYCEPCRGKERVSAEFWCVTCQKKLCNSCNDDHTCQKQSKHNKTVPMNVMEQNIQSDITFDQNCAQHPSYKLETFCVTHRALCCGLCISAIHRDCDDIRDINCAAEDQAKRCNYHDFTKQISQIKTEIAKILSETNSCSIDKSGKQIKCFQITITNAQQIFEALKDRITSREKFIVFETICSQVASHYEQLKLTTQDDVEMHLSLKANTALHNIEKLSSPGAVQTSSKQPGSFKNRLKSVDDFMKKLSSLSKLSTELSAAQIAKPMTSHVTFVKAVKSKKYGRRTLFGVGDDTWFRGGTVLPDGRLLMADSNNKRLVQLDEQYNMVKDYKLDGGPRDVAAGQSNNEIYITVQKDGNYVYKCRLDTGLTVVSRIKAPPGTWSIATTGDNIIVGTYDAVVILKQDGTTLKSMPRSGFWSYVAVSQTKRTMYHRDNDDVVCRTLEGSEMYRYRHHQLEEPRGICTDTRGCMYICGQNSHNVHQVSPDGKTSTILELHTISQPYCCVFLPQWNELLVTSYKEDTALEVYKLE